MLKKTFFLSVVILVCINVIGQTDEHYAKLSSLDLYYIPQNIRSTIMLGRGYDLTDPWYPVIAQTSPFLTRPTASGNGNGIINTNGMINRNGLGNNTLFQEVLKPKVIAPSNGSNEYTLHYDDHIDEKTVAQFLHADLKVKGLSYSVEASMDYVHTHYDVSQGVRFVLENKATMPDLQEVNSDWKTAPATEKNTGVDEIGKWKLFKGKYGSHYVSSFSYGYRIEILAFANSSVDNSKLKLHAAFSAWSAKGNIDAEISQNIQSSGANIDIKIFCQDIKNNVTGSSIPFIITGIPGVMQFLKDLNDGKIVVTPAPTTVSFKSFAPSVCGNYPVTCKLFEEVVIPADINAVPKGSIIAWYPQPQNIKVEGGVTTIIPPAGGWVICDKRNHDLNSRIPDLSDKFLYGTSDPTKLDEEGGSLTNSHTTISMSAPEAIQDSYHWQAGDRKMTVEAAANLPPYKRVVYIIKL